MRAVIYYDVDNVFRCVCAEQSHRSHMHKDRAVTVDYPDLAVRLFLCYRKCY